MSFIQSFKGCGKTFFFNNQIQLQVRPLRTFTPNTSFILFAGRSPLKANIVPFSFLKGTKFFSYSPLKSNLRRLLDGDTSRYARLNRFQAASPNYNNNGELLKLTLWGLGYMAAVYFATPYLFNMTPLSYFKFHPSHLTYAFIGINLAVFGMWQLPRFWVPLQRYALLRKDRIYSKLSLVGSTFSHQEFWHLAMNMMCLWSFGTSLAMLLGPANFTSLYLNCAMAGSLFSLWFPKIARLATMAPSLGASGALFGLFATFSYLVPHAKIMLFFIPIPVGAWFTFLGLTAWNFLGCTLRWGVLDYAAHLGGSALGVLYGWWISNRMKKQKARRMLSFPRF